MHGVQRAQIDAVVLLRHAFHTRLHVPERRNRAGVGRKLHEDHVARVEQHAGHQIERLLRPRRHEQPIARRGNPAVLHDGAGDQIEQRPIAARRPVLQHAAVRSRQQLVRDRLEVGPRKRLDRRVAGGERDDVPILREDLAHPADGRLLHFARRPRQERIVGGHASRWPEISAAASGARTAARL